MTQIRDFARTLLPRLGVEDAQKLLWRAAELGTEGRTELRQMLQPTSEFASAWTEGGRQAVETALASKPGVKPVSMLVPNLWEVTDFETLPARFLSDVKAAKAELTQAAGLTRLDQAQRTLEFFQPYARKFRSLGAEVSEAKKLEVAKQLADGLKSVGHASLLLADPDKDEAQTVVELLMGDNPNAYTARADRKPWTGTYWPVAGPGFHEKDGDGLSNLWAKDGPMARLDKLLKKRGQPTGALEHERKPMLNWMLGHSEIMKGKVRHTDAANKGHYIPDSTLSEKDAERTTGVDWNGNGRLDANVKWDFLDPWGNFGTDGKVDGTMDVGWFGECNNVALAGIFWEAPKRAVTVDGVTFEPEHIQGLLTVIAKSQMKRTKWVGDRYDAQPDEVRLKSGETLKGRISTTFTLHQEGLSRSGDRVTLKDGWPEKLTMTTTTGEQKELSGEEIASITREDVRDDPVVMHNKMREMLKTGRPAVMDESNDSQVWNYPFWRLEDFESFTKPSWAPTELVRFDGKKPDAKSRIQYVERRVALAGSTSGPTFRYWLELDAAGKPVSGNWIGSSPSPDFLWGPDEDALFVGDNTRNPFVKPELVKELYLQSIAEET